MASQEFIDTLLKKIDSLNADKLALSSKNQALSADNASLLRDIIKLGHENRKIQSELISTPRDIAHKYEEQIAYMKEEFKIVTDRMHTDTATIIADKTEQLNVAEEISKILQEALYAKEAVVEDLNLRLQLSEAINDEHKLAFEKKCHDHAQLEAACRNASGHAQSKRTSFV